MGAQGQLERISDPAVRAWILHERRKAALASWIPSISTFVPSDKRVEEYLDIGSVPRMGLWKGKREHESLREIPFLITNQKYSAGIEIDVDDLRRDKINRLRPTIQELAASDVEHWTELTSNLVVNGASSKCYDDKFFFATDHQEAGSPTQSNKINVDISLLPVQNHGSVTEPSEAEFARAVLKGIKQILMLQDDKARPINGGAQKFVCMYPVAYTDVGGSAATNRTLESGAINPLVASGFQITPIANSWLDSLGSWTDKFVVFRADGRRKPFIRQEEIGGKLSSLTDNTVPSHFEDKWLYAIKAVRAAGYADWKGSCQVTLT